MKALRWRRRIERDSDMEEEPFCGDLNRVQINIHYEFNGFDLLTYQLAHINSMKKSS